MVSVDVKHHVYYECINALMMNIVMMVVVGMMMMIDVSVLSLNHLMLWSTLLSSFHHQHHCHPFSQHGQHHCCHFSGSMDWEWWDECVPEKLQKLDKDGYRVVFFTNQAGMEKGIVKPETVKDKVEAMIKGLGIPVQVSQVQLH